MMNKQIRELEKQSVFYNEETEKWELNLEKFAELIVRECADICYNREYTDGTRYGDEIIEHFGVEE